MAFGHSCHILAVTLAAEQVGSQIAVGYVGSGAVTVDSGCVSEKYAYVMEHGGFLNSLQVDRKMSPSGYFHRKRGHRTAVAQKNIPKG